MRRLLPALLFTILITFPLIYIFYLPSDFISFKQSIIYILTFAGNIYFWNNSDYFSPSTDLMPFSHLWSLGVEEQFYVILPIFLYLIFKFKLFKKI